MVRPGDPAVARQGAEHRERVTCQGAREQGTDGFRHGPRQRAGEKFRPGALTLRPDHHPCGCRLGRPPHRDSAAYVHLQAHARPHHRRARVPCATTALSHRHRQGDDSWALDDGHRERILKQHGNGRANPEITRFKGLANRMPARAAGDDPQPEDRRLLRVEISDQIVTDRVINELMAAISARFRFIMERAEYAEELDV